jgi:hypothetical protein
MALEERDPRAIGREHRRDAPAVEGQTRARRSVGLDGVDVGASERIAVDERDAPVAGRPSCGRRRSDEDRHQHECEGASHGVESRARF